MQACGGGAAACRVLASPGSAGAGARLQRAVRGAEAARVLVAAIQRHAWTFAGSGRVSAVLPRRARPLVLEIRHNPLCRGLRAGVPACDYYAATFERLFQVLVHGDSQVRETACEACGDDACRFELRW